MKGKGKAALQINFGFARNTISGCGRVDGVMLAVTAPSIPVLLRKVIKRYGIKQENIVLTFQPGTLKV